VFVDGQLELSSQPVTCHYTVSTKRTSYIFGMQFERSYKMITSKPTWKLMHTNSSLESFEYTWQMSSKLILIISIYTVSK